MKNNSELILNKKEIINDLEENNFFNSNFLSKIQFKEKIIQVKRVIKVTKGGKNLNFRSIAIVGDLENKIGFGVGHAVDVATATKKALFYAKKKLILVPLTNNNTIPYPITLSYKASKIFLSPKKKGTGIISSNSIRSIFEFSGIKNIVSKQIGSNNILNNIKLVFLALLKLNNKIELYKHQKLLNFNNNIKNYFIY
jgi:small subunit ribosomal protein S5